MNTLPAIPNSFITEIFDRTKPITPQNSLLAEPVFEIASTDTASELEISTTTPISTTRAKKTKKPATKPNKNKMGDEMEIETSSIIPTTAPLMPATHSSSFMPPTYLSGSEYNSSTRISIFTLTALLGCIYGLAFILAIVWIIWLWLRRRSMNAFKSSQISNSRDFCSVNSMSWECFFCVGYVWLGTVLVLCIKRRIYLYLF